MSIVKTLKDISEKLFCKHEYITLTNIHGDAINQFNGARSISECVKCGKQRYNKYLDPECLNVNEF